VQSVPDQVEGRNLVCEEFDGEEGKGGDDDGPCGEQLQSRRKWKMSKARQESEDGDRGVEIESGGESDRGQHGEEFAGRDLQDVQHWALVPRTTAGSSSGLRPGSE
jgi:hypothetical protein